MFWLREYAPKLKALGLRPVEEHSVYMLGIMLIKCCREGYISGGFLLYSRQPVFVRVLLESRDAYNLVSILKCMASML